MKKTKETKRALLSSALAMVLCLAMLIGTTFAWFTDSASTSVNKIQAGTLDIQLLDAAGNSLEGQTLTWKKAADGAEQEVLWEPGCTYELQPITIKNNGNLALKYKIQITGIQGDAELNTAIEWTINDADLGADHSLAAGAVKTLTIKGHMQESAGNEYQGLSIDGIAITVLATQDTDEYDSTTNQYDSGAAYDEVVVVQNEADLKNAVENLSSESTNIILPKSTAEEPITTNFSIPAGKDVTISGATDNPADTTLNGQIAATTNGTLIIRNCTIKVDDSINDSTNISQTGSSGIAVWGDQDVICENVVFDMSLTDSTAITAWWSTGDGANISVRNCTFNCNGQRPIRSDASVTVESCTFNDPYRYAVQMTSKANTITAEGNAVVNFYNNTIIAGNSSSKPVVYGVQLEGETYGCANLTINGSNNTINLGSTEKTGTMYVFEGTNKIHDIIWNVSDGTPVNIVE